MGAINNNNRPVSIGRRKRSRAPNGVTSTSLVTSLHSFVMLSRHCTRTGRDSEMRSRKRRDLSSCFAELSGTKVGFRTVPPARPKISSEPQIYWLICDFRVCGGDGFKVESELEIRPHELRLPRSKIIHCNQKFVPENSVARLTECARVLCVGTVKSLSERFD